jgi:hypothetical protein
MPTTYTPGDSSNPTSFSLPADLEPNTAESYNSPLRALADKVTYTLAAAAKLAAENIFTAQQHVEPVNESQAVLRSDRYPGSITTDNRWTLIFRFRVENNVHLRMFTGGLHGVGRMAWTINTSWDVDEQQWELDDDEAGAAAIIWRTTAVTFHQVSAGTDPFQSWPSAGLCDVRATGEFLYAQTKTRVRTIPVSSASGPSTFNGGNGGVSAGTVGIQSFIRFPLRLPPGAVLQKVSVLHTITTSAVETFRLTRRRTTWDPYDPVAPTETWLITVDSDSSTGTKITEIPISATVDRYDELCLLWIPSAEASNRVEAIKVEWADQGPTPI